MGRELRVAWRRLAATPSMTVAMVVTLALGTGATVSVFRVLDPLVLRALPVRSPSELVFLHAAGTLGTSEWADRGMVEYDQTRRDLFQGVLWETGVGDASVPLNGTRVALRADTVSPNFFDLLGLVPSAGRLSVLTEEAAR